MEQTFVLILVIHFYTGQEERNILETTLKAAFFFSHPKGNYSGPSRL